MKTRIIVCLTVALLFCLNSMSAQLFNITYPAGGEIFQGRGVVRIQWSNTYTGFEVVQFSLSTNGGASFTNFSRPDTITSANGYFDLAIPNTPSNSCIIRANGNGTIAFTAISGIFAISPFPAPTLNITMPTDTTVCLYSVFTLSPVISGGQPPYQCVWTDANPYFSTRILSVGDTLNTLIGTNHPYDAGYVINFAVTDANGLTGFDTIHINFYPIGFFNLEHHFYYGGMPVAYIPCNPPGRIPIEQNGGVQMVSYQWVSASGQSALSDNSLSPLVPPGSNDSTYILYATDINGCRVPYDTITTLLECNDLPVLASDDCYQLTTPDSSDGVYAYFYLHILNNDVFDTSHTYGFLTFSNPSAGTVNSIVQGQLRNAGYWTSTNGPVIQNDYFIYKIPLSAVGTPDSFQYILFDAPSPNVYDTGWVRINTSCQVDSVMVWPGDTYNDGYVDNTSLLPIGVGYGTSGIVRPNATISWVGQNCNSWTGSLATGSNYKYIDCNGDGTINADDTMAIHNNFFLVHARSGNPESVLGAPALSIVTLKDTVLNGDTLHALIVLGDSATPASNVYGVAFDINIDPLVVDTHYLHIQYINSWLGNTGELLTMSKYFAQEGLIKTAVTRFDHTGRSGFGAIATADFLITTSNINGKDLQYYKAMLSTAKIRMLDSVGNPLTVNSTQNSSQVGFYPSSVDVTQLQLSSAVKIFPNPANSQITINSGFGNIGSVKIEDMFGQQIESYSPAGNSLQIDVSKLANGIYLAQVQIAGSTITKRIVIAR